VATWHTLSTARAEWSDAPKTDSTLTSLLIAARHQCEAFAPAAKIVDATAIPEEFRMAHLMQARAIWQAQNTATNPAGEFEAGGQTVRVYPMDWNVKSLLRPAVGVPGIG
jgi:hypothetical protein